MNAERLTKLADFLESSVPDDKFNLEKWSTGLDLNECGTAACACGWATQLFSNEGFVLAPEKYHTQRCCVMDGKRLKSFLD